MKNIIFLVGLVVILSFCNSCSVGYVAEEPVYQDYNRPPRPSDDYIWMEGGWSWNKRTSTYVQLNGNWERNNNKDTHTRGHWERNRHGSRWIKHK